MDTLPDADIAQAWTSRAGFGSSEANDPAPDGLPPVRTTDRIREVDIALRTDDGFSLAATVFEPPVARAVALIAPATGVPRGFYSSFARWLGARGYAVLTLDYRGIAGSRASAPGRIQASMGDWMQLDLPAALAAVRRRASFGTQRLGVLWVGHSLGGHALARLRGLGHIDAAIGVAAQLPSFHLWPRWHQRWGARFFFERWVPWCVRTFGYLPGWAIGGGEDLPASAAMDWSRWGMTRGYFTGDPGVQVTASEWRGVAHLWCITDDWVFGPRPAIEALQRVLDGSAGSAVVREIAPKDLGTRRLGHFGPFRRKVAASFWATMLEAIEREVPTLRGCAT